MRFIFLLPIMFVLANCAVSPELSAVRSECYAEARERFPVRIEEYICTRYKTIEVDTGRTNCTSYVYENTVNTQCEKVMQSKSVSYEAICSKDMNEADRYKYSGYCIPKTCIERYGDRDCIAPEAVSPPPVLEKEDAAETLST